MSTEATKIGMSVQDCINHAEQREALTVQSMTCSQIDAVVLHVAINHDKALVCHTNTVTSLSSCVRLFRLLPGKRHRPAAGHSR